MQPQSNTPCQEPQDQDCRLDVWHPSPDRTLLLVNRLVIHDPLAIARVILTHQTYGLSYEDSINALLGANRLPEF